MPVIGSQIGYVLIEQEGGVEIRYLNGEGELVASSIPNTIPSEALAGILKHRNYSTAPQRSNVPARVGGQAQAPVRPSVDRQNAKVVFRGPLDACKSYVESPETSGLLVTEPTTHFVLEFPTGLRRISQMQDGSIPSVGQLMPFTGPAPQQ